MKREDIIRMASDSGMELYGLGNDRETFIYYLEAFAKLIAALERENILRKLSALHDELSLQSDPSKLMSRGKE